MSCDFYSGWQGYEDGYYTAPPSLGGVPCNPSISGGGTGNLPNNIGNLGGWPAGSQGQLSQVLNSILSGIALITNQQYVPTPLQSGQVPQGASGQQSYVIPSYYNQGYGNYGGGSGGNAAGAFQRYIEQHPMVVAAIAIGGVLLLLPRPIQSRRNGIRKVRRIKRGLR